MTLLVTFITLSAGNVLTSAQQKKQSATTQQSMKNNPFRIKSPLQYQAPEFDKIKDDHYKPAFD